MYSTSIRHIESGSYLKSLRHIFISYLIFLCIIALFGKGYGAASSLGIILFSCGIAVLYTIYAAQKIVFKSSDYLITIIIFAVQVLIGIIHFQVVVDPNYFTLSTQGVDISGGRYYWDVAYFGHLVDSIAKLRLEGGYFYISIPEEALHKNYILASLISDIFYFGDAYILNYIAINFLSLFYSGVILALVANKLFNDLDLNKRRIVFYLTILQPLAWIPSHTMRDVFGAFIVVLSIAFILFSVTTLQKIVFGIISIFLVFQHRTVYALSALASIILQNKIYSISYKPGKFSIAITITVLIFLILASEFGELLMQLLIQSYGNSMLSGANNDRDANIIEHAIKLIVGPFPWTQYIDGSVKGYATFYSSIIIFQAAWHLSIIYFLFSKIKVIFYSEELRKYFYFILFFSVPAILSLGGMNLYLLPSSMLATALVPIISLKKFLTTFMTVVSLYIFLSTIFFFLIKF